VSAEPLAPAVEAKWRKMLVEGHRPFKIMRAIFRHLPSEPRCKVCNNPFGGIGGQLVGLFGFHPSAMNPNVCKQCCEGLPRGGAEVDIAVLFADVRGSTGLGAQLGSTDYAALLNRFYTAATHALLKHDAIIDKLIGDEVMALFIPGICGAEYRRKAVLAARDLLSAVGYGTSGPWLSVGVGVHAGAAYVGNVGAEAIVDFTALGDTVNVASRLQHEAGPGEIAITGDLFAHVEEQFPHAVQREIALRGRDDRVTVHTLRMT
jgi:adenylate cyclase